ncbi:MAG: radical SAM protein [Acidobacteria bacterium]|nr:radical SAM protein [Acidobacteriota bacterium]
MSERPEPLAEPTTAWRLRTVNFHITRRCNLRCPCCYESRSPVPDLPLDAVDGIVTQVAAAGVKRLMLSGGDPLLRDDLPAIIARARELRLEVYLATNGLLLTAPLIERMNSAPPDLIFLGVDPFTRPNDKDARIHDAVRDNLRLLREHGRPFVINLIVTHPNLPHLPEAIRRLRDMGARHFSLLRPKPDHTGTWFPNARLTPTDLRRLQFLRLRLAREADVRLSLDCAFGCLVFGLMTPEALTQREFYACNAGLTYLHIDARGDAFPCPYLSGPEYRCGNLRTKSLNEIWRHSPVLNEFRHPNFLKGRCGDCAISRHCRGCRALADHAHGDVRADDPDCPYLQIAANPAHASLSELREELRRFAEYMGDKEGGIS